MARILRPAQHESGCESTDVMSGAAIKPARRQNGTEHPEATGSVGALGTSRAPRSGRMRLVERSLERVLLAGDVFDSFPYGIMVVDRQGRMVACNRALKDITGLADRPGTELTCCELFGCNDPAGSLPGRCLTELALEAGGRLSELRIQLPWGSSADAVYVTVSPLGGPTRVLFHVRPGHRRPASPAVPAADAAPRLRIYTLGRCRVHSVHGPVEGDWLLQRPGQLLKFLVTERDRVVPVEEIAETLWPDRGLQALTNVRHFVHLLRSKLEPDRERGASSFIVGLGGGYTIDRRRVAIDADEFVVNVEKGIAELTAGNTDAAQASLVGAMRLYRGDFLDDERYADWAFAGRNRLRRLAARALEALGDVKRDAGDLEGASDAFERLAALEPFDMDVQRRLLAVCLKRGRRSEAVRRYKSLRVHMLHTFGEEPGFSLADLAGDSAA